MNKRQFLLGLSATVGAALTPAMIEVVVNAAPDIDFQTYLNKWVEDWSKVYGDYISDVLIFGRGMFKTIDTYPFIERVDPMTVEYIPDPHAFQGLALKIATPLPIGDEEG